MSEICYGSTIPSDPPSVELPSPRNYKTVYAYLSAVRAVRASKQAVWRMLQKAGAYFLPRMDDIAWGFKFENYEGIRDIYLIDCASQADPVRITREDILIALLKAAKHEHQDTEFLASKDSLLICGSYPHVYQNKPDEIDGSTTWPVIVVPPGSRFDLGPSMKNGQYFEYPVERGFSRGTPKDARVVYTISAGDRGAKPDAPKKRPEVIRFVGIMHHDSNKRKPFHVVRGKDDPCRYRARDTSLRSPVSISKLPQLLETSRSEAQGAHSAVQELDPNQSSGDFAFRLQAEPRLSANDKLIQSLRHIRSHLIEIATEMDMIINPLD